LQPSILAKRGSVLLFLAVASFYFYGLGHLPLVGPDEPRYAQVAREMFLRHDLITPTLGGHTWFEKPALLYWMMIGSFKLFGVSEWAARLPAAVSGLLTLAAVYTIARRLERTDERLSGYGFWSVVAAATTIGIFIFSRAASFDIILTMTTSWALGFYALHEMEKDAKLQSWFLAGFYIFIGLSLLAKGLVGIVMPLGVVSFYYLFRRKLPQKSVVVSLIWGIPLALVVAATWYGPVISRHGWTFIDQFFIQHHFARYVSNKYHHWRPVYYYLIVIPLLVLPWNAFLFDALMRARRWPWRAGTLMLRPDDSLSRLMIFALAWSLFPFLFFSFANSKLPGYLVPILPAVALIVGQRFWRFQSEQGITNWAIRTTGMLCVLFALGGLAYAWRTNEMTGLCAFLMGAPLVIAGCFALFSRYKAAASILLIAGATLVVMIVALHCGAPQAAEHESSKRLLELAGERGYSSTVIYGMQRSDRTPEFYAAGRVIYDSDGEPVMYEGPLQVIAESQRRADFVLAFVPLKGVSQLTGMSSAETDVIANNGRYAIVAVKSRQSLALKVRRWCDCGFAAGGIGRGFSRINANLKNSSISKPGTKSGRPCFCLS
jgi:4-amino-4-deoxy-L-arabinose transferase-like glycosyltransferase